MNNIDKAIFDIISNKSYNVRKAWMDDRMLQSKHKQPFDVSSCIDRLNASLKSSRAKASRAKAQIDLSSEPIKQKTLF